MQLYNCTVRLNGTLTNNVRKHDVTAAEIAILRHIHGQSESSNDPVFDIHAYDLVEGPKDADEKPTFYKVPKGTLNRSPAAERSRLAMSYSMGDIPGSRIVIDVLGAGMAPLPTTVEGVDVPEDETPKPERPAIPIVENLAEPPRRTRVPARETVAA
jgi:hypothetical protein